MTDPTLSDLTPEQRALLMLRLRQKSARRSPDESAGPVLRQLDRAAAAEIPLSFAQQRLWFVDQWQPQNPAYNIPAAIRAVGKLDEEALQWALDEIVRRHESLRTGFEMAGDQPVQILREAEPLAVPRIDLAALPAERRDAEARRVIEAEALRPFDLAHGRLLRASLLRLAPDDHAVLVDMHHIVSDGWSIGIFVREFAALYEARVQGLPSPLPDLPVQYPDFAVWQREWLGSAALEAQLDYWRRTLAGLPEAIELPLGRPRPPVRSARGGRALYELHPEVAVPLKELAQREGATLFMVLLAALYTLLHRYSGEADLVVGSPVAGRNRAELEGLIGFFVNNLVLRVDLSGDPTFRELLGRVREATLGAQSHPDVPFEKLVEELRPGRDLSRPPLYQVVLSMQNTPQVELALPGLTLRPLAFEPGTAKNDLLLSATEGDGWVGGFLEYSLDLFDSTAAGRILEHFRALAEGISRDPDRRLSELPLLAEEERWQLLGEWNDTAEDLPSYGFGEEWDRRAGVWADREAVASAQESLTYRELSRRANQLAHHLRSLGVGPEVMVGVLMERSPEAVVAMLSVWKAGGVYVPLDPAYPEERLAMMLEDTGLAVILTQERLASTLPWNAGFMIQMDAEWGSISRHPGESFDSGALPGNLAYVIFTSGSTGRPKGVMIQYGGFNVLGLSQERLFGPGGGERLLLFAPLAFDTAIFDWMLALWRGNTLCFAGPDELLPGPALLRLLRAERISSLTLTPSALSALPAEELPDLTRIWVAGEACPPELVTRWWRPERVFYNGYGPTETTIWVTTEICDDSGRVPPIGRPAVNKRVYVLDARLSPVPVGAVGEMYVGGEGLARGYLHRPDLTAERFVPDPFQEEEGARLYRTGDLVRYGEDGRLLFVGRNDHQVKIRGFRIELGEIEAVLSRHPALREAAVVVREDGGDRRLAAFFVLRPGSEAGGDELRTYLRERLPEFMVPATITLLPALPLTPNDKLDRRALAAIDPAAPAASREPLAPRTPVEELLALIVAEVLGLDRIGVRDGFFDLGGHSLLATQALSRVREAFGVEVPLTAFFERPTVEGLAASLASAASLPEAPPLVPRSREGGDPLSFAQQRLWFLDQLDSGSAVYNVPGAVRLSGRLDVAALARSFGEIVRRHEVLRTSFPAVEGRPVQAVALPRETWRLPVADLGGLPADLRTAEVLRLGTDEARQPFDLAAGPLVRAVLLRLGPEDQGLVFTMHHIVSDGWSMGVLIGELARLYTAFLAGGPSEPPSPLPELPVQYADFARWQREWLRGDALEAQLAYWRHQLAGAAPLLELPTDRPRPTEPSARGESTGFVLEEETAAALQTLSRRRGATLFMTLLAAFQVLLARLARQEDVSVGTPIAGRNRIETEGLIGFFVNTLVLRADLSGDPPFGELLGRVRTAALGAFSHQDLPFELLVEELRPERALSHTPLFQVMFSLQNAPAQPLDLPGLTLAPLPADLGVAKFDLDLDVTEVPEGGLAVQADYRTELFDRATVERWLAGFRLLLEGIAADPDRRLSELPLLSEAEQEQLAQWAGVVAPIPDACIHHLIEAQAARTPEAVAVIWGEDRLTYRDLDRKAEVLASHLRAAGVGPEARVAILAERSVDLPLAMLAVWKAGGAYVPLDPAYPRERLDFMLADARPAALLAQGRLLGRVVDPDAPGLPVVLLESEGAAAGAGGDGGRSLRAPSPGNAAYVIYTSGSTGRPKGVVVTHRSLVSGCQAWVEAYGLRAEPLRCLGTVSFSFDVFAQDVLRALGSGSTLVLCPMELLGDPAELYRLMVRESIGLADFVPAIVKGLAGYLEESGERADFLRWVVVGGESWTIDDLERLARGCGPETRIINIYGLTEATIDSCRFEGTEIPLSGSASIPIGRPYRNVSVRLLDGALQRSPMGSAGELCLGGAGVARGYLGRPDLTAERFVPDPYGEAGERLYRTGDLARWLPDGNLQFLGRSDQQVKVRGLRVEPGEIEAAVAAHPGVREAAVIPQGEGTDRRLVAFVVPREGTLPPDLRAAVRARLPEALVPAAFVALEALPLTPNGKVDRKALAEIAPQAAERDGVEEAPEDQIQELVAAAWREVLGLERVGVNEGFFDLGGHSLLATQVMSRLRSTFGVELPLRRLFETPTVAGLSRAVTEALRGSGGQPAPPLRPVPRDRNLPLSFAQERLWFLEQLQPGTAAYHMVTVLRLQGSLEAGALTWSLERIAERHEALRTRFPTVDGRPIQEIEPASGLALSSVDLSGEPADRREAAAAALIEEAIALPFDLTLDLPLRAVLLRLGEDEHVAVLVLHHIASDGWSMGILVRELSAFYEAAVTGAAPVVPDLPVQYADFAVWQREWLRGEVLEAQLAYWRRQLDGAPPVLDLPTDRPRPIVAGPRGAGDGLEVGEEIGAALQDLSRRSGVTLFMTLLAAFQTLLSRLSGQRDVVVGTPIAGRLQLETEGLIGFFVNTLVLRADLSDDPTFEELLGQVREASLGAFAHQDLPFEKLVDELRPERALSHTPLFQAMFAFQNAPAPPLELPGLQLAPVPAELDTSKFDLNLEAMESGGGLGLHVGYRTDLFDATTIARWLAGFRNLLEAIARQPDRPVSELPLLGEAERHQLLVELAGAAAGPIPEVCAHHLIEAQAERTPDALAVVWQGERLTYRALDHRAEALASHLRAAGVGPETRVAILAERSVDLPVAVLAVWKAGGAYVPLDPGHPRDRLAYMLADAAPAALLTQERLLGLVPETGVPTVLLEEEDRVDGDIRRMPVEAGHAAYVIYTSGSTGHPKGAVIDHRSVVNLYRALAEAYGLEEEPRRHLQTASFSFDVFVADLVSALSSGGSLVICPEGLVADPGRLLGERSADFDTVHLVPTLAKAMTDYLEETGRRLDTVRLLLVGAETWAVEDYIRLLRRVEPGTRVFNVYGVTEAAVDSCCFEGPALPSPGAASVPIGRPFLNMGMLLLDAGLRPVPLGVAGELFLRGDGLARCYHDRPALTAERFVPDPFGEPGGRLYRTGDLARWLPDGNLLFLGRIDHQIKIRGFRIEVGEIEAALKAHPAVRTAVTLVRNDRLVAYTVPHEPGMVPADELVSSLREALRETLPAYMIPAAFVVLDALPLNRNGKVDRRALPDPAAAERAEARVPPRTPIESLLAGMWREVIGLPEDSTAFGVHDNFFDLGGDSIKGAIFINRLRQRLGEMIPVAALFDAPTIAELAAFLAGDHPAAVERISSEAAGFEEEGFSPELAALWERAGAGGSDLDERLTDLDLRREPGPARLSFAQERLWFLHRLDPEGAAYNMPQAFFLRGPLDTEALDLVFREVLRRHETLRTRFVLEGGRPAVVLDPVPRIVLPRVDLAALGERAAGEARRLAIEEALRPFDLESGPVVRNVLLHLAPQEHAVFFTSHHIACDGWSMGLWAQEIEALYAAFTTGRPSPLAEPPVQYADFARWQRSWLQGAALEAQVAYWRERLRGLPPSLDLPLDRPRPPFQTFRGGAVSAFVPADRADRIRGLSGRHNASLFMTLLAVFLLHLHRLSGQDDIAVGSPIAGRTRPEVEGLIGCFLNTLVLRVDLSGAPSFLDLLRRVREASLGAFSYQDVPFEKLLEELRPERDTSRASLFQVLFNMLNAPGGDVALPGLEIGPVAKEVPLAKFDWTLYVLEREGGLHLELVYNADLFDRSRMEETLRQYEGLLGQVVDSPEASIDGYSLLTAEALAVLPDPAAPLTFPWPGAVHDLFEAQARRTPEQIALVDRAGEWTYGELDVAVRRLAARLQAEGIHRGDRVAVYAHRGAALAWALLGILKAGAVFTILDPVYPAPRLVERLRMAEPRGFLHLESSGPLPQDLARTVEEYPCRLTLPAAISDISSFTGPPLPDDGAWPVMGPYDAASIAFTSGSTGVPKGIVQTHGSMSYFLPWHEEVLGFTSADRHTMLSGLAHDPLQRDVFYSLGTGAALCVPDPDRIGAPGYLAEWMREQRVTVTNLTPAMGQVLAEIPPGAAVPQLLDLRCAILAGDILTRLDVARLRRLAPRALFVNVYGSTESHRALSFHFVEEEDGRDRKQTLPLGRGQRGSQLLVVTSGAQRAGIGELGEVVIRSPHLAQGYLKDEALTREKLRMNPFTGEPGDRVYFTGDLGRYRPDGEVEAAGRADQQVKIRGFRVEPGEIEAELGRLPGIQEAVVVARTLGAQEGGERQLTAYLVLDPEQPASLREVRERLRERLPAYMVPAVWVTLDRLPVNPNGKVDRLALPVPEPAGLPASRQAVPPRDELELRLVQIWEEVLGSGPIGVTDSFFEAGGHSLLAVRLMARIESELGTSLPLAVLFQSGTVEELAAVLRRQAPGSTTLEEALVVLRAGGSRPPLFLVHPVGGQVLSYVELVRLLDPEQPVYAFQDIAPPAAERSLAGMASEYLEEVLAVQPEGPYLVAGWSFGGRIAFEMARQLEKRGREVAFLGMIDTGFVIPPARPEREDDAALLQEILVNVPLDVEELRRSEDPVATLVEKARQSGALPPDYSPAAARRLLEVLKSHLRLAASERLWPYPGKLTYFSAQEPPPGEVFDPVADPTRGWGALAGSVEVVPVPGNHVTLIHGPANVAVLADRLGTAVERALAVEVHAG